MKLLRQFSIASGKKDRKIELFNGDLSALTKDQFVDLLVVSAFPNNYTPTANSLIGALHQKGLSVYDLSLDKSEDMRQELGCWFSKELSPEFQSTLNIKRILCFEPLTQSASASEVVGNIFRCINNFVFNEALNNVALPIVASGNQKVPLSEMFEALLDASLFWMNRGLPLHSIKLVHKDADMNGMLENIFDSKTIPQGFTFDDNLSFPGEYEKATTGSQKQTKGVEFSPGDEMAESTSYDAMEESAPKKGASKSRDRSTKMSSPASAVAPMPQAPSSSPSNDLGYDLFVSYSHKQKDATDSFVKEMKAVKPGIRIFYDDDSIPKGAQWLKDICDAIDISKKVIIFISPEYTKSKICWDEFQCAKVREYNSDAVLLITIYLMSHEKLPTIFQLNNWIDCREADDAKIKAACSEVIKALDV